MPRIKSANKENDSGAAPRGRGRPPKRPVSVPREVAAAENVSEEPCVKRGRGRPKKNATSVPPPATQNHGNNQSTSVAPTNKGPTEVKRMSGEPPASNMTTPKSTKRGRPRKVPTSGDESPEKKKNKLAQKETNFSESDDPESNSDYEAESVAQKKRGRPKGPQKKRGRPKKVGTEKPEETQTDGDEEEPDPEAQPKKKRGRKKNQVDVRSEAKKEEVSKTKANEVDTTVAENAEPEVFEILATEVPKVAREEVVTSKKKRGRPPKAKPKQQEIKDSDTKSVKNATNKKGDEVPIVSEVHDSANPVDTIARAVSPPTALLPQKILATPDGSEEDSDSDEEEEEKEKEDGENKKSDSEDEDENRSDGNGNGGESGEFGENQEDGDDDHAPEEEEESEDDEPQNSQQTSGKTARCTAVTMRDDLVTNTKHLPNLTNDFQLSSAEKKIVENLPPFQQMSRYWSKIADNLSAETLIDYKNKLQGILTGRVSALKAIEKLVPGFPKSLLHEHDRLYALLCQTSGAVSLNEWEASINYLFSIRSKTTREPLSSRDSGLPTTIKLELRLSSTVFFVGSCHSTFSLNLLSARTSKTLFELVKQCLPSNIFNYRLASRISLKKPTFFFRKTTTSSAASTSRCH